MQTEFLFRAVPDAWEQIKMLIGRDTFANGFQKFIRNVPGNFFTWFKWRDGCSNAAGSAVIARIDDRQISHASSSSSASFF